MIESSLAGGGRGWRSEPPGSCAPGWQRGLLVGAAILAVALPLLARRLPLAAYNYDVGHADSAAYALQGLSLATGHGLKVPYVSGFYRPYPRDIRRTDDHWPPFLAFVLAPVFRTHGADASRAHAVMLVIGTVCLPLAAAWLAGAATRRAWAALLCGSLPLLSPAILGESAAILSDMALAALVAGYAAALLSARRHRAWFVVCGLFGALAYYAKGSQLVLLPLLPAFAVLAHGWRILASRWLYAGCLAFALAAAPWWIANGVAYGNPFHSTQNYVASFFGLSERMWEDWDEEFYRVYWGHDLPSPLDRFRDRAAFGDSVRRNAEEYLRAAILGPDASRRDWPALGRVGTEIESALRTVASRERDARRALRPGGSVVPPPSAWVRPPREWPYWYATLTQGTGLLWGSLALLLWAPLGVGAAVLRRRRNRDPTTRANIPRPAAANLRAAAFLMALVLVESGFVIVFWCAMPRFTTLVLLPLSALGTLVFAGICDALRAGVAWAGAFAVRGRSRCARALAWFASPRGVVARRTAHGAATGILCLAVVLVWHARMDGLVAVQNRRLRFRERTEPRYPRYHALAQAIRAQLPPDAVLMSRNPWELLFYCPPGMRAVGLPHATPDVIFAVARYYGVTHFVWDKNRPGLREMFGTGHQALTRVIAAPLPVYAISYAGFAPGELADEERLGRPAPARETR